MMVKQVKRGEVYTTVLGKGMGSEHQGHKYCVVVQNNIGNIYSPTTVVIPISKSFKDMPTHVEINEVLPLKSYVVCEQIRVVDKNRLLNKVGTLSSEIMKEVSDKIKIQLQLF